MNKLSTIILSLLVAVCIIAGGYVFYNRESVTRVTKAVAVVHPTEGNNMVDVVTFTEESGGVRVHAGARNLTPGKHGFHVHQLGDCSCPDASCAAGHFNPTGKPHGGPTNPQRHIGDLGNIVADENGAAEYEYVDPVLSLNGPHSIIGRSVIIHAGEDDLVSQPTGGSGARIGCGVIGIAKESK